METFSTLLSLCEGNPPVTGGFPSQRPVTLSFDLFFDMRLNKIFSKQSRLWWFETSSHHAHYDVTVMITNLLWMNVTLSNLPPEKAVNGCLPYWFAAHASSGGGWQVLSLAHAFQCLLFCQNKSRGPCQAAIFFGRFGQCTLLPTRDGREYEMTTQNDPVSRFQYFCDGK